MTEARSATFERFEQLQLFLHGSSYNDDGSIGKERS